MQLQNVIPVILLLIVAIIVILFSYLIFKKWLTRKQAYIAVFAVLLFISFITLKTIVHYNFIIFQVDLGWKAALLAAVIFFIIISPLILLIDSIIRKIKTKTVPIKDTPVSVPIFEEKIDTLPDKRSFGILNEDIYENEDHPDEILTPFEKIPEISPMEQVLSNIESRQTEVIQITEEPETEIIPEEPENEIKFSEEIKSGNSANDETTEQLKQAEEKVSVKKTPSAKEKKTVSKSADKKTARKIPAEKTSKSKSTGGKKTK